MCSEMDATVSRNSKQNMLSRERERENEKCHAVIKKSIQFDVDYHKRCKNKVIRKDQRLGCQGEI